jgi:hypothetical protein
MHLDSGPICKLTWHLIISNHVTWTSCEKRWQNDPLSDGNNAIVTCSDGILKALIKICMKFFLTQAQIP